MWNSDDGIVSETLRLFNFKTGVIKIGGANQYSTETCDVKTSWKNDEGKSYMHVLHNFLLFPSSLVKVTSIHDLVGKFLDDFVHPDKLYQFFMEL